MHLSLFSKYFSSPKVAPTQVTEKTTDSQMEPIANYLGVPVKELAKLTEDERSAKIIDEINTRGHEAFSRQPELILHEFTFRNPSNRPFQFPENVRLTNCKVREGKIAFSRGKLMATNLFAAAEACGADAIAMSRDGGRAYANGGGAQAIAFEDGTAEATVAGAVAYSKGANSKSYASCAGAKCIAEGAGTEAHATEGGIARATASSSKAFAAHENSRCYADFQGSIAESSSFAEAYATVPGSKALASVKAFAYAEAPRSIARADGERSVAVQMHPKSIARFGNSYVKEIGAKVILFEQARRLPERGTGGIQDAYGNMFISDQDLNQDLLD